MKETSSYGAGMGVGEKLPIGKEYEQALLTLEMSHIFWIVDTWVYLCKMHYIPLIILVYFIMHTVQTQDRPP